MGSSNFRDVVLSAYIQSFIQLKAKQLSTQNPRFRPHEREDLVQELNRRLLEKVDQYKPERGASFDTFANRVILSEVQMMDRERKRLKRAAGTKMRSLDEPYQGRSDNRDDDDLADTRASQISYEDQDRGKSGTGQPRGLPPDDQKAFSKALAALPPDPKRFCLRFMIHGSVKRAAEETGVSRRQALTFLKKMQEQFRPCGFGKS